MFTIHNSSEETPDTSLLSDDYLSQQEIEFLQKCGFSEEEIVEYAVESNKIRSQEAWSNYDLVQVLRQFPAYVEYEQKGI